VGAAGSGILNMKTLEDQLQTAGLQVSGCCLQLSSAYGEDLLQASQLLQDMTPAEADILGASMLMIRAQPGEVLIREGDAGEWMLLLLKGTVDVTKRVESRIEPRLEPQLEEQPAAQVLQLDPWDEKPALSALSATLSRVAVLRRGAAIGEMSMLDSEPRYTSCTAIEAVEAGVLGRREIGLLIRDHPGVGAKLLVKITQLMAQRLRNTSNQLVKLLQKK
jgi:CRP/FNR family cyclic AMP-dependent transcriptional regulator